ncbi:MAG: hypothetical protein WCH98_21220 [Verrucomicrobiota bacterium]
MKTPRVTLFALLFAVLSAGAEELQTYKWIATERPQSWTNPENWEGPNPPPLNPTDRAVFYKSGVEFNIGMGSEQVDLGELSIEGGHIVLGGHSPIRFGTIKILSGMNTYTGGTVVHEGALILEKGGTLASKVQVKGGQFVDRNK